MAALHVAFAFFIVNLLGGGFGIADEEFQSIHPIVAKIIGQLNAKIVELAGGLGNEVKRNKEMEEMIRTQDQDIRRLTAIVTRHEAALKSDNQKWKPEVLEPAVAQNSTIEERVTLLDIQVADLREDVTVVQGDVLEVDEDLTELEGDVNFLFDEQIIQDERLFSLEQTSLQVAVELAEINANILDLDTRVVVLEENGGDDGNSSVAELEVRVEILEGTASDHETRLTVAEADIEGLQETDMDHDERISALEENGSRSENNTIAFHSVLTSYSTIPFGSNVIFNEGILNEGEGYDSTAGVFTVPPGGDGVYYFSTYVLVNDGEQGTFDMRLNNNAVICLTHLDHSASGETDSVQGSCSAVLDVVAGDEVEVVFITDTDTTPLSASITNLYNGFNGFRI